MRGTGFIMTGIIIAGVGVLNYFVFLSMIQDELIHKIIKYLCYSFYGLGGFFVLLGLIYAIKPKK